MMSCRIRTGMFRHPLAVGALLAVYSSAAADEPFPLPDIPRPNLVTRDEPAKKDADAKKKDDKKRDDKDADKKGDDDKEKDVEKRPAWKAWAPTGQPLTLAQCLQLGRERQPAIHAAQASLAASERGYLALNDLKRPVLAELFSPDLPVRRQQSQRGIAAACAELVKAQQENTYDVTRLYYTYVFATQQEQTATDIVEQMEAFYDSALEFLKLEIPDPKVKINEFTLGTLDGIIGEVRELRDRASSGRKVAYHALKEAMSLGPEFEFVPADKELPLMQGAISEEQVVALALSRRAELTQAAVVVDVTRLEVCAQGLQKRKQVVPTFASGSDLHARVLPAPQRNGEYRPGAIPPQMPAQLVGKVEDRVARAHDFVRHQEACYTKAVDLIRLESVKAFVEWQSAGERVKETKLRHERAQKLLEKSRAAAAAKMDPELLVRNESLASQAQAKYVDAVYKHLLALVALEKVTGGGITPAFPGR